MQSRYFSSCSGDELYFINGTAMFDNLLAKKP